MRLKQTANDKRLPYIMYTRRRVTASYDSKSSFLQYSLTYQKTICFITVKPPGHYKSDPFFSLSSSFASWVGPAGYADSMGPRSFSPSNEDRRSQRQPLPH
ncbi:hypothetical protein J6590_007861 [Homalodisca vitripennis]|nr:hypothetical protein J6590_007861 [Homalodisca vitripennis]